MKARDRRHRCSACHELGHDCGHCPTTQLPVEPSESVAREMYALAMQIVAKPRRTAT